MSKRTLLLVALLAAALGAFAEDSPRQMLERGVTLFEAERYRESIEIFGALLADPKVREERPDAAYWSALAYIAAGENAAAERSIEAFLSTYPSSPKVPDLLYQRGRLLFGRGAYEAAIASFAAFMAAAPAHELYPSALYWSGECLYSLGRLDEAERAFAAVIERFPKSVKVEAAAYRRSLIALEFRQEELLKLLTWSHEESLRVVEDFRRRERAYEQAIAVYQKQIAEAKRGAADASEKESLDLRSQVAELTRRLGASEADLASARAELATLRAELERSRQEAASPVVVPPPPAVPLSPELAASASSSLQVAEALAAKSRALDLLAFYLERLAGGTEK